jgi:hypothetical protein
MNILDLKRKLLPMSGFQGGGSSPSSTTTSTTGLPEWAKGYAQDTLAKQAALSNRPYEAYDAPRIQGFTPMQVQAQQQAASMKTSPELGQAAGIVGGIASQAQNASYTPGQFNAQQVNAPGLQNYQMGPAERVSTQSFTGQGTADQYMNPYMQSVVDIQKREAGRQSGIQGTQQQAQATQAGAFGGSRDAIMRAERERNLGQQMGDIQAQGSNAAFQQAQQQFNAEQQARLAAQQANQQAGLTTGIQNLAANLGVQQLGAGQNLQAQLANQQMGMTAQQAAEQSRQYGAGYGMQGLQTGLSAAGQLGALGSQRFNQGMDINRLQSAYGAQEQAMGQAGLTQAYQDWQNQRDYPQQQLGNMANMIRGLPIGSTTNSSGTYNQGSPSFGQQLGSLGSAAWGLKQFFAEGGSVDSQQNVESIVSKLSDQELAQAEEAAKARGDVEQLQAIQTEKAARASMNRGLASLPVNMDEMLPTEQSMARGGIVAFAGGGTGYNPNASPSSDTGEDATLDDEEDTNAPAQGPGSQAIYEDALRQQLEQAKAVAGAKYEPMKPEDYNRAIEERRASLLKGIGESPYEGMRADAKRLGEESAQNLKYGKGLAALQAASAMLQGNDLSRGLAAGAGAFGSTYGEAIKADQAQKAAIQRMNINIADAERKERMGLTKDAIAAADQARKDHQAAQQFGIDKAKALGKVYQGVAATARPGAAPKAPAPAKVAELLAAAEIALENNPNDPQAQRNVAALRRTADRMAVRNISSVGDFGGGRLASIEAGQDINRQKYASDREKDMLKQVQYTPEFRNLKPEEQARIKADIKNEARAYYGLPLEAAAPATAPKAGPAATKPMSAADFNAKWATLKSGQKLVGPDGIEYTKK